MISHEGLRVRADTTVAECPELDVLIVPSSADMAPIVADEQAVAFVAAQGRTAGTLASHCAGAPAEPGQSTEGQRARSKITAATDHYLGGN